MRVLAALSTLVLGFALSLAPALARDQYVVDNAHLFSATAVQATNEKLADFNSRTGKEIFVYTTPSLDGMTPQNAAERVFAQQQVNGVMLFIAKSPKTIGVVPDRASRAFFPSGSEKAIRDAIAASFNSGNFDAGLQNGVSLTENMYLSHLPARRTGNAPVAAPRAHVTSGGFSMGWIFLILIVIVGFLVLRAIFRAIFAPRVTGPYGPGQMGAGPGYGPGPGYGGYGGYGPGFGGGGSFWSGLLGGLGGAWLGNELFGQHNINPNVGGAGFVPGEDAGGAQDAAGFQSDPGQADMGNASFGDWGGSGGDSGGGWGGGDGGGGFGGGDFGGGSGGGW
jgi:uncharacterized membrane protein YgcG